MRFVDNIIINEMGFTTTTHDLCFYHKVIDDETIFMLRQVDDLMLACKKEQTAENFFNDIGRRISFDTKKAQVIIPFEYLGVENDYNGVEIKQTTNYIEMSCET